tara:strand:- start:50567 stop:53161 length:2595 start_codon:yes stop_codon:yes gene_type:complete
MIKLSWLDKVFGDRAEEQAAPKYRPKGMEAPMLGNWLPYRSYDEEKELFFNTESVGFVMELTPLLGADERIGEIISNFLSSGVPSSSDLQIVAHQSPRVGDILKNYSLPRYVAGGVFRKMAEHRIEKLSKGAFDSLSSDGPFHVRHHRVFLSYACPYGKVEESEVKALRENIVSLLQTIDVTAKLMTPVELISLCDDFTRPSFDVSDHMDEYSPFDPIADQCVRKDVQTIVKPERLIMSCEPLRAVSRLSGELEYEKIKPDRFDVRMFSIRNLPERFAPWDMQKLVGDMFSDKMRAACPTITSITLHYPDEEAESSRSNYKFLRTKSLADSQSAKYLPNLADQASEYQELQKLQRQGVKTVQAYFCVGTVSPLGKGDAHERNIKSMYKAAGWDLIDELFLQSMSFLSLFPMTAGNGLSRDIDRMKRFKRIPTSSAASICPLQGEYVGGHLPHLMFIGRRAQPFFWSPFENGAGNHNVAVYGKSGSGKSVTLQELCASLAGVGSKVIVIDDGRSFEHLAKMIGGEFIEFRLRDGFSVNPFSMIDGDMVENDEDYLIDVMAMLKSMIGQMARHVDRLSDLERGMIDSAVNAVWQEYGRDGSIDAVAEFLFAERHPVAEDLAKSMFPFTTKGTFGKFFIGEATVDVSASLVVFELSDLASREELRSVVLTAIMFLSSQAMRRMDRTVPKALLIDEAWQMLKGGSMADFVEIYARTCRKYGGSLITATQSKKDYYKSEGSIAALENSDWEIIMQQKSDSITDMLGGEDQNRWTTSLIRSLKRNGTEYSELLIRGPDVEAVGRLVLDNYSATLYSSSPLVFGKIEELLEKGMSMDEAVEHVAFENADIESTDNQEGRGLDSGIMLEAAE